MIFDQWRRTRLANLIAARAAYSAATSISPNRASMLANKLSLKHLRRVDAFTKKYPDYFPELPEKIVVVYSAQRDDYLDHLELLARKVREMERLYGKLDNDSDIPFYVDEIIGHVLTFLQRRSIPELTDQQKSALVAVYFLITKYWTPDSYPDEFPKRLHPGGRLTPGKWLTEYTLSHPEDTDAIYHEHLQRVDRRKFLARIFSDAGNPLTPDAIPEVMCDYTGDIIQKMHAVALQNHNDAFVLLSLARDGITAVQMNEVLHFTSLTPDIFFSRVARATTTLRSYDAFKDRPDLTLVDAKAHEQCMALIRVSGLTARIAPEFLSSDGTIRDIRLVNLLLEYPDRGTELAYLIRERGTADFDLLMSITSNVLGEGLL